MMTRLWPRHVATLSAALVLALSTSGPIQAADPGAIPSCDVPVERSESESGLGREFAGSKVYALLIRLPGMSMTEFSEHWRDPHGTLTKRLPYFKRYVQNHFLLDADGVDGFTPIAYDGIPSVWVSDENDLQRAFEDPDYAELDADVDKLYQRDKTVWIQGTEYTWCRTPEIAAGDTVKAMLFLNKDEGPDFDARLAEFLSRVRTAAPSAVEISTLVPADAGQAAYDAVVEILFASEDDYQQAWGESGGAISAAASEFADMNDSGAFLARGEVVVPEEDAP